MRPPDEEAPKASWQDALKRSLEARRPLPPRFLPVPGKRLEPVPPPSSQPRSFLPGTILYGAIQKSFSGAGSNSGLRLCPSPNKIRHSSKASLPGYSNSPSFLAFRISSNSAMNSPMSLNCLYTDANRTYATSSHSRNWLITFSPTSELSISFLPNSWK